MNEDPEVHRGDVLHRLSSDALELAGACLDRSGLDYLLRVDHHASELSTVIGLHRLATIGLGDHAIRRVGCTTALNVPQNRIAHLEFVGRKPLDFTHQVSANAAKADFLSGL